MYDTITITMKRGGKVQNALRAVVCGVAVFAFLAAAPPLYAAESSFSQGFTSKTDIETGAVVSLGGNGRSVEKSSIGAPEKMVGVVARDAVLEVSDGNERQIPVATGGRTLALVSDINGDISAGDKVTISPINGVGMKAIGSGYIYGTAQANFSVAEGISLQTIEAKDGKNQAVKIGLLPVQVGVVQYNSETDSSSILPEFLVEFASALAGKEVSVVRISIALAVLLIGTLSIGLILVSAVRSSITSIGRNPLAAKAVHKGLFQVLLITLGILITMLGIIYIILVI